MRFYLNFTPVVEWGRTWSNHPRWWVPAGPGRLRGRWGRGSSRTGATTFLQQNIIPAMYYSMFQKFRHLRQCTVHWLRCRNFWNILYVLCITIHNEAAKSGFGLSAISLLSALKLQYNFLEVFCSFQRYCSICSYNTISENECSLQPTTQCTSQGPRYDVIIWL